MAGRPLIFETWEEAERKRVTDSFGNNDFKSEKHLSVVGEMIKEYNLPFEIYVLSKSQILKMKEVL